MKPMIHVSLLGVYGHTSFHGGRFIDVGVFEAVWLYEDRLIYTINDQNHIMLTKKENDWYFHDHYQKEDDIPDGPWEVISMIPVHEKQYKK